MVYFYLTKSTRAWSALKSLTFPFSYVLLGRKFTGRFQEIYAGQFFWLQCKRRHMWWNQHTNTMKSGVCTTVYYQYIDLYSYVIYICRIRTSPTFSNQMFKFEIATLSNNRSVGEFWHVSDVPKVVQTSNENPPSQPQVFTSSCLLFGFAFLSQPLVSPLSQVKPGLHSVDTKSVLPSHFKTC